MLLQMVQIKVDWTEEIEAYLINAVRLRPHLWDPNCKSVKLKQNLYTEIAEEMISKYCFHRSLFTRQSLLQKFKNFRTYYRKELIKRKTAKPGYKTIWSHFERLSFLSDPANFVPNSVINDLPEDESQDPNPEEIQLEELDNHESSKHLDTSNFNDDTEVENFSNSETGEFEQHNELVCYNSRKSLKRKAENSLYEEAETSSEGLTSARTIEERSFGMYIGVRMSRIKNRTKRNNLIIELLNLIKSYEDEEDNSNE